MLLFIYTIVLLVIYLLSISLGIASWTITRSRRYLIWAALIAVYLTSLLLCFGDEWSVQNLPVEVGNNYYSIRFPLTRTAVAAASTLGLWALADELTGRNDHRASFAASGIICAASLLIVYALPYGPVRQWLFYAIQSISALTCLLRGIIVSKNTGRNTAANRKLIITGLLLSTFVIGTLLEDTLMILVLPIPGSDSNPALVFFSYVSVFDGAFTITMALLLTREALSLLALHFNRPIGYRDSSVNNIRMNDRLELALPTFAARYGLTGRESEILSHVIAGESNRTIAQKLYVVEGTVKTHLYNIMKKTGTSSRDELRQLFWSN